MKLNAKLIHWVPEKNASNLEVKLRVGRSKLRPKTSACQSFEYGGALALATRKNPENTKSGLEDSYINSAISQVCVFVEVIHSTTRVISNENPKRHGVSIRV